MALNSVNLHEEEAKIKKAEQKRRFCKFINILRDSFIGGKKNINSLILDNKS